MAARAMIQLRTVPHSNRVLDEQVESCHLILTTGWVNWPFTLPCIASLSSASDLARVFTETDSALWLQTISFSTALLLAVVIFFGREIYILCRRR
jgi:hypothetical protein